MRSYLIIFSLSAIFTGCTNMYPNTREEFIQGYKNPGMFALKDTYVAKAPFDTVVNTLKQKADECFNIQVKTSTTRSGGTTTHVNDYYTSTVRVINANRAEWTSQHNSSVYIQSTMPKGGVYMRAIDIERISPGTTKLTYYGNNLEAGKRTWETFKLWSDGKVSICPKDQS